MSSDRADSCGSARRAEAGSEDTYAIPQPIQRSGGDADDFHRLDALQTLATSSDERTVPMAEMMLREERKSFRRNSNGFPKLSSVHMIGALVRDYLRESANQILRKLAE